MELREGGKGKEIVNNIEILHICADRGHNNM
jgi:hypothetical protein